MSCTGWVHSRVDCERQSQIDFVVSLGDRRLAQKHNPSAFRVGALVVLRVDTGFEIERLLSPQRIVFQQVLGLCFIIDCDGQNVVQHLDLVPNVVTDFDIGKRQLVIFSVRRH